MRAGSPRNGSRRRGAGRKSPERSRSSKRACSFRSFSPPGAQAKPLKRYGTRLPSPSGNDPRRLPARHHSERSPRHSTTGAPGRARDDVSRHAVGAGRGRLLRNLLQQCSAATTRVTTRCVGRHARCQLGWVSAGDADISYLVERSGLEPPTPCLQSRCSTELSYRPLQPLRVTRGKRGAMREYSLARRGSR